jgi:hypothetical protein
MTVAKSALCMPYNNGYEHNSNGHKRCDGTIYPDGTCLCVCHKSEGNDLTMVEVDGTPVAFTLALVQILVSWRIARRTVTQVTSSRKRGMVQFLQHYCPNCFAPVTLIDADQIDPSIFDHLGERS